MQDLANTWTAPLSNQISRLTPMRILLMGLGLSAALAGFAYGLVFKGLFEAVVPLRQKVPAVAPPALEDDQVLARLQQQVETVRAEVRVEREKVSEVAKSMGEVTGEEVYVQIISDIDSAIAKHGLTLVQRAEDGGMAGKGARSGLLGEFRQQYVIKGDFAAILSLLAELNQLPYLCRIGDLSLTTAKAQASDRTEYSILQIQFNTTIYYIRRGAAL